MTDVVSTTNLFLQVEVQLFKAALIVCFLLLTFMERKKTSGKTNFDHNVPLIILWTLEIQQENWKIENRTIFLHL